MSGAAILKVNPLPEVSLTSGPVPQVMPGATTTLFATSNPEGVTYQWKLNGSVITGATASTYVANVNGLGKYQVTITDGNGCMNTTNELSITELRSNELFIYPNPTSDGIFHVRFFNYYLTQRTINIYNTLGRLVATKTFDMSTAYQEATFDLSGVAAGIYIVEVKHPRMALKAFGKIIIR